MEYDLTSIGKRIAEIRESMNLTKEKFGNSLGVTSDAIYNIENARNKAINMPLVIAIAAKYNFEENWILYGSEPKYSNNVSILQKLKNTYDLSNLEFSILEKYLKLDKSQRVSFEKFLDNILNTDPPENEHTKNQNDDTNTNNNKENKVIGNNNAISENKNTNDDTYITTVAARGNSEQKVKISKKAIAEAINKPMSTEFDD